MKLRTVSGRVRLRVKIGYSQQRRRWLNPIRQIWQMAPSQQVSPELQARSARRRRWFPPMKARWKRPGAGVVPSAMI